MPFAFSEKDMRSNMKRLSHEVDLNLCLHWVDEDSRASTSRFKHKLGESFDHLAAAEGKADMVACYVNFSLLYTFNFLTSVPARGLGMPVPPDARLTLSHFGYAALEFGPEFSFEAITFLLVVMFGEINGQPLDPSDQPVDTPVEVRFISRALALLP